MGHHKWLVESNYLHKCALRYKYGIDWNAHMWTKPPYYTGPAKPVSRMTALYSRFHDASIKGTIDKNEASLLGAKCIKPSSSSHLIPIIHYVAEKFSATFTQARWTAPLGRTKYQIAVET